MMKPNMISLREKYHTLVLMALMSFISSAQTGFYREGTTPERVQGRMVTTGDYLFVNAVSLEAADAGLSNIYRYDGSGNSIRFTTGKYVWNMLPAGHDRLLLLSEERRCTMNPDTLGFFVEIVTTGGTLLSSLKLDDGVSAIVQTPDSSYLAFLWDHQTMLRIDKAVSSFTAVSHTLGAVWDAMLCSNGKIALSHNPGNGERLSQLNSDGSVVFSKPVASTLNRLRPMGVDRITSFSQFSIYVFDLNLDVVQAKQVPYIADYYFFNDTIYALMRKSTGTAIYYTTMDKDLKILSQKAFQNYQPIFIKKFKEFSAIISEPNVLAKGWLGHYLSTIPRNDGPGLSRNLSLSTQVDSAFIVTRGDGFFDVYARLNFNVSTFGKGVQKFSISTELSPGINCGISYHTMQYSVAVPGGSLVKVKGDTFLKKKGELYNGAVYVDFCSTVARPDDEFDSFPQNNLSCAMVSFDPTAIAELTTDRLTCTVAPNPANGHISVSSSGPVTHAGVYTAQGMLVKTVVCDSPQFKITIDDLPAGLYLLRLYAGKEHCVRRFVKL